MVEKTSGTVSIEAPIGRVQQLLFDIEKHPTWSLAIKSLDVLERDESGRVTSAKLKIDAGIMKDRVTLDYDWSAAPGKLSFSLTDADLLTAMDGAFILSADDADTTQVTYELAVDLSMPIPAMMRQKAEKATIDMTLNQLKTIAEE